MFNIYFSRKRESRYYVGEASCHSCKENIDCNLFVNLHWSKKHKPILETYCLNCIKKMKDYGRELAEKTPYVLIDSVDLLPRDAYPIFTRPPTLINPKNLNVFEAAFVNSEAEIIDNTKLSGRPDHNAALEIQKNKELLEKRDEELGQSAFMLTDERRKIEEETRTLHKLPGEQKEKKEKELKERAEKFNKKLDDDLDIDGFLSGVKNSKPLIEEEERRKLT